jgi:hypothetical protein
MGVSSSKFAIKNYFLTKIHHNFTHRNSKHRFSNYLVTMFQPRHKMDSFSLQAIKVIVGHGPGARRRHNFTAPTPGSL